MGPKKKVEQSKGRSPAYMRTLYRPLTDHEPDTSQTRRRSERIQNLSSTPSRQPSNESIDHEHDATNQYPRSTHREGSFASPPPHVTSGGVGQSRFARSETGRRTRYSEERVSPPSPSPGGHGKRKRSPELLEDAQGKPKKVQRTHDRAPFTPERAPLTPDRAPRTPVRAPRTSVRAPRTSVGAPLMPENARMGQFPQPLGSLQSPFTPRQPPNPFADVRSSYSSSGGQRHPRADREIPHQFMPRSESGPSNRNRNPFASATANPHNQPSNPRGQSSRQFERERNETPNASAAQGRGDVMSPSSPHPRAPLPALQDLIPMDAEAEHQALVANPDSDVDDDNDNDNNNDRMELMVDPPPTRSFLARLTDATIELTTVRIPSAFLAGHRTIRENRYARLIYIAGGVTLAAGVVYAVVILSGGRVVVATQWDTLNVAEMNFDAQWCTQAVQDALNSDAYQRVLEDDHAAHGALHWYG